MKILEVLTPLRKRGNLGERAAVKFLRRAGYKILDRNAVVDRVGEIDAVAKKDGTLVIVEVKTRSRDTLKVGERPADAVTHEKRRRLLKAGSIYHRKQHGDLKLRFDVIEVYTDILRGRERAVEIKHIIGAFDGAELKRSAKGFYKH